MLIGRCYNSDNRNIKATCHARATQESNIGGASSGSGLLRQLLFVLARYRQTLVTVQYAQHVTAKHVRCNTSRHVRMNTVDTLRSLEQDSCVTPHKKSHLMGHASLSEERRPALHRALFLMAPELTG